MEDTRKMVARVFRVVAACQRWEQAEAIRASIPSDDGLLTMYRCHVFCGLVYVAWEAYGALEVPNEEVDRIATSDFIDRLRRFRNVWFHDQEDMFDKRYLDFSEINGLATAYELHSALQGYFAVLLEYEKLRTVVAQETEGVSLEAFEKITDEHWDALPEWFKDRGQAEDQ